MRSGRLWMALALALAVAAGVPAPGRAYDDVIDSPMYRDPDVPMPRVVEVFPEGAKALWLKALERPEAEGRYQAAAAIARARREGVRGLEATVPALVAALDRADDPSAVRLAAVEALVALDAREAAPSLLRAAQAGGDDLRDLAEPALARWDYQPARDAWLARLADPAATQRGLVLALRGLGAVREARAADRLREWVLAAHTPRPVRLEAARALGELRPDGLEKDAERLAGEPSPGGVTARLVAATLLRRHRGAEAVRVLQRLARDDEPAVAAVAVRRLTEIAPELVVPLLEPLLASPDAQVRRLAVEVLFRRPTSPHLRLLAGRLDDAHPDVRVRARQALRELAGKPEHREQILADAARVLGARSWRGQEQAAILLTQLDHKPATGRLLELLESERPEVLVTAGWALRKLDVPETLPAVTRYVEKRVGQVLGNPAALERPLPPGLDHQLSQLNQFLGRRKHAPAEPVLRRFVAHNPSKPAEGPEQRAAAVWALGLIHEGKDVPELAVALEGRLNDTRSIPPEVPQVRWMSAVTLGRMKAKQALGSLRKYCPDQRPTLDPITNACGWAVERLSGEALAPPGTIRKVRPDWFLLPHG